MAPCSVHQIGFCLSPVFAKRDRKSLQYTGCSGNIQSSGRTIPATPQAAQLAQAYFEPDQHQTLPRSNWLNTSNPIRASITKTKRSTSLAKRGKRKGTILIRPLGWIAFQGGLLKCHRERSKMANKDRQLSLNGFVFAVKGGRLSVGTNLIS